MSGFVEQNCTFKHEGRDFTSGGAWICDCSDGFRRGVVYASPNHTQTSLLDARSGEAIGECCGKVTDWHGNEIARAMFGAIYRGNYCRMRSVSFTVDGLLFTGRYCPDTSQAVRVKSTKRVPK